MNDNYRIIPTFRDAARVLIVTAVCGSIIGYAAYKAMTWWFA